MKRVVGYCDKWVVRPGDHIDVMASTHGADRLHAHFVRMRCNDDRPGGVGIKETVIADLTPGGAIGCGQQKTSIGSWGYCDLRTPLPQGRDFTVQTFLRATLRKKTPQTVLAGYGARGNLAWDVHLDAAGRLVFGIEAGGRRREARSTDPLPLDRWYLVICRYETTTDTISLELSHRSLLVHHAERVAAATDGLGVGEVVRVTLGAAAPVASAEPARHFNGLLDRPRIAASSLTNPQAEAQAAPRPGSNDPALIAAWDFSRGIGTTSFHDLGANGNHGVLVNLPSRGCKGENWTGRHMAWPDAPEEYGAVHFHDDDLYDAGWQPTLTFQVPADLRSGVYAVRLTAMGDVFHIPVFVRPPAGKPAAPLALLASTATYLAYANRQFDMFDEFQEVKRPSMLVLNEEDVFAAENAWVGLSSYDKHADGSGNRFSSRLRPMLHVMTAGGIWSLGADLHLIDWLEECGIAYDVVTDDDLDAEGVGAVADYRCVMTGTHPEYCTTAMRSALERFVEAGGRLMYMGGNGFYWRCAFHRELPGVMELRRAENGARQWVEEPGEYHMECNGEAGGLWRNLGAPPQALVGVGMVAAGSDRSSYYRRKPGSRDARAGFIFEGVSGEVFGAFGTVGDGAAGEELDAVDFALGTPPHAIVLASSEMHSDEYYLVPEEVPFLHPMVTGALSGRVRADMVFFETPAGGAVFSTGSIAWAASLAYDGYKNEVSAVTRNVVTRFLNPMPFPYPGIFDV